jgi:hypothetical protein
MIVAQFRLPPIQGARILTVLVSKQPKEPEADAFPA